jgi:hypothetical protein
MAMDFNEKESWGAENEALERMRMRLKVWELRRG